jgi:hypothetical protein
MKHITRPVHTFKKAFAKAKEALRNKAEDADSPAYDAVIQHYKRMALAFARTDAERNAAAAL